MSWKEDTNDTTTYRTNHTQEEILDGVFREEMQQSTVTEAEKAKARMEDAVYKGSLHTEERTANHAAAAKKPKKNGFAVIVATGLICSIVGGSIGGVVGANIAQSKYEEMSYTQSGTDRDTTVQLVGNQNEISPVIAIAKKVMPSVVGVHTYGTYSYWGRQITNMALGDGSGVIYSEDGYIITNYHVIEDA
ncbi:MAG: serine protease, partial [Peptococcaceae bacterium]|nr:serine protease [Peptococcaceae bacterium]